MDATDLPDADAVVAGEVDLSDPGLLEQLSAHPLDCVDTEFPHHARGMEDPEDVERPADQHPVFYRRSRPSASGLDPEGEGRKPN